MKKLNLYPTFTTKVKQMFNCIETIDNPYLQAWVDAGAYVMSSGKTDYWIMTNSVQLLFKIHEDSMHLECIATYHEDRRKGHGSEMMEYITQFSNESGVPVTLKVANVTGNGWQMMQHTVISMGMVKTNKIPVQSLPKWYEKFGFIKSPSYSEKNKSMIYTPKKLAI